VYLLSALGLAALMITVRGVVPPGTGSGRSSVTMAVGFLLLSAYLLGWVAKSIGLPRITGYLLTGLLFGPDLLNAVTARNLADLELISRFAIGIIAFVAGGELRPKLLRERGRGVALVLACEMLAVLLVVGGLMLALKSYVPFLAPLDWPAAAALTFVFAAIATVHSPAVTIALLNETRATGPVASTTLAVVVLADVVVVLLVTLALALARAVLGDGGIGAGYMLGVGWELIGALIAGGALGAGIALYLRHVRTSLIFFVIFVIFFGYELAAALHVEFMLFMLAAGFFVENVSPVEGGPLIAAVEKLSVPAFALFFAVAGASIHLQELALMWPLALAIVVARALALRFGSRAGARMAGLEPQVRDYTWRGLVSQAGVALGLVTVAARALAPQGDAMLTLFLAMIAIHELVGPLLFRSALRAAGELEQAGGDEAALEPVPVRT
jgi:Kef-type K+ transport system membrane component KefB